MDKLYFARTRGDKRVLQEMEWKSMTDANAAGRNLCLEKILSGEYVVIQVAVPRSLITNITE